MKGQKLNRTRLNVIILAISLFFMVDGYAGLDTREYGFYSITNNRFDDAQTGQQQLSVQVSDHGSMTEDGHTVKRVGFRFNNTGPDDSVITEIYFQGGSLLEYVLMNESDGVNFDEAGVGDISSHNLPGGKSMTPQFIADAAFSIEPLAPEPFHGVGPGQWVEVVYALQPASTLMDIINQLDNAEMRIGIHVQGFAGGGSESFVNVPQPATMALLGLGGLVLRKRR